MVMGLRERILSGALPSQVECGSVGAPCGEPLGPTLMQWPAWWLVGWVLSQCCIFKAARKMQEPAEEQDSARTGLWVEGQARGQWLWERWSSGLTAATYTGTRASQAILLQPAWPAIHSAVFPGLLGGARDTTGPFLYC